MASAVKNGTIYEFADFRLIPDEQLLLHNGEPVSLNHKAFRVLTLLVERHGHLVEKSEILDLAWTDSFVEEGSLSKAIWFVRQALGDTSKERFIQTIPRRGYRFVAPVSVLNETSETQPRSEFISTGYRLPVELKGNGFDREPDNKDNDAIVQSRKYNSIAVLSFVNLSSNAEDEYFCDGLAEELLNALAKIGGLKVAARTSSFSFKGKDTGINEIGRLLNVQTVLEGSVRRSRDTIRITVQLIDAESGYHIWSERFDRRTEDIFDVQDEITLATLDTLKVALIGDVREAVLKRHTDDHEAYELYLKGRFHFNKYTEEGRVTAIDYFEKAIAIDPDFAPAYADIGLCLGVSLFFGFRSPRETAPRWKAVVDRAIELDDGLADGHVAQALFQFYYERNLELAEKEFQRGISINPNDAVARSRYGLLLGVLGRIEQAIEEGLKAHEVDPISLAIKLYAGWIYYNAGRSEEALGMVGEMIELEPRYYAAYWLKAQILLVQKNYDGAIEAARESLVLSRQQLALSILGVALAKAGRVEEASGVIDELLEMGRRGLPVGFTLARVYAGLEQLDPAFKWLDHAIEERQCDIVYLEVLVSAGGDSDWGEGFRQDPRYKKALHRLGLTERSIPATAYDQGKTDIEAPQRLDDRSKEPVSKTVERRTLKLGALAVYIGLGVTFFGGISLYYLLSGQNILGKGDISRIAVLPLKSVDVGHRDELYELGIAESLILKLGTDKKLSVRQLNAVRSYVDVNEDPLKAGREQNVDYVLSGNYQIANGKIRVTAQLLDVGTGKIEGTFTSNYDVIDSFAAQDAIANDIGNKLLVRFGSDTTEFKSKRGTSNEAAYQNYQQAMTLLDQQRPGSIAKAREYLDRAVELDPNYAKAWAGKAYAYSVIWGSGRPSVPENRESLYERSMDAAKRAFVIDPNLSEVYTSLCENKFAYEFNADEAENDCKRAIDLDPTSSLAHRMYSMLLMSRGRSAEAFAEIKTAMELEPLSLRNQRIFANGLYYPRRYEEAIEVYKRLLDLNPETPATHLYLIRCLERSGREPEALEILVKLSELHKKDVATIGRFRAAYASSGWRGVLNEQIQTELREESPQYSVVAEFYGSLGEKDKAFEYLEKNLPKHGWMKMFFRVDPRFDPLRDDPRFEDIARRIEAPR